jgi:hypothetical protein
VSEFYEKFVIAAAASRPLERAPKAEFPANCAPAQTPLPPARRCLEKPIFAPAAFAWEWTGRLH